MIITEAELMERLKSAAKNVNMDEIKKEWEKNKNNYSETEAEKIFLDVKKDMEK
jgi:hypothetical protein